jgi:hypothetical protein
MIIQKELQFGTITPIKMKLSKHQGKARWSATFCPETAKCVEAETEKEMVHRLKFS